MPTVLADAVSSPTLVTVALMVIVSPDCSEIGRAVVFETARSGFVVGSSGSGWSGSGCIVTVAGVAAQVLSTQT